MDTAATPAFRYEEVDLFKRLAQQAARDMNSDPERVSCFKRLGVVPMEDTRGESVFLYWNNGHYIGHVIEGLGTKNLVADSLERLMSSVSYYALLAKDTVAMINNDMITLAVFPFGIAMYVAIGDPKWMKNEPRLEALIHGWKDACIESQCTWGGGETPLLRDIVHPDCAELLGSAVGKTIGDLRFHAEDVAPGDLILVFESSGIHANGLTDVRGIAQTLPQQYLTEVPGTGKSFGELLLRPTHLYVNAIEMMVRTGVRIKYCINITGHGLRKFMRAPQPLTYVIDTMPEPDPIFGFIQEHGKFSDKKMCETFNMKFGFAVIVPSGERVAVEGFLRKHSFPFRGFWAGHVEAGDKRVIIEPMNALTLDNLAIR